jgi:hypothetical protein
MTPLGVAVGSVIIHVFPHPHPLASVADTHARIARRDRSFAAARHVEIVTAVKSLRSCKREGEFVYFFWFGLCPPCVFGGHREAGSSSRLPATKSGARWGERGQQDARCCGRADGPPCSHALLQTLRLAGVWLPFIQLLSLI